jgi:hypothetical protein
MRDISRLAGSSAWSLVAARSPADSARAKVGSSLRVDLTYVAEVVNDNALN